MMGRGEQHLGDLGNGNGNGQDDALRGEGVIEDPDTDVVVTHGLPRTPEPGEVQIQPRNTDHDVVRHAVHSEGASTFTVQVDPAPGSTQAFEFGWLWTPAELAAPLPYAEEVAADSPFAWWRFEETGGITVADEQGNHDGTTVNGPDLDVDGRVGSGIEFDGVNERVNVGTLGNLGSSISSGFTVEFWARWTVTALNYFHGVLNDGTTMLVQGGVNANVNASSNVPGAVQFSFRGGNGNIVNRRSGASDLDDGEWHHIVFVWEGGTMVNCYVDGALDNGDTSNTGTPGSFANFGYDYTVAARNVRGSIGNHFPGRLDEFAVYLSALTAERIAAHYAARDVPEGS